MCSVHNSDLSTVDFTGICFYYCTQRRILINKLFLHILTYHVLFSHKILFHSTFQKNYLLKSWKNILSRIGLDTSIEWLKSCLFVCVNLDFIGNLVNNFIRLLKQVNLINLVISEWLYWHTTQKQFTSYLSFKIVIVNEVYGLFVFVYLSLIITIIINYDKLTQTNPIWSDIFEWANLGSKPLPKGNMAIYWIE